MSRTQWIGGNGDWKTVADWSRGVPDSPNARAILGGASAFTLRVGAGESFTVGAVSITDAAATLSLSGTLTARGDVSLGGGSLDLKAGGEIAHGTIVTGSGAVLCDGGTLDACEIVGPLNLGGGKPVLRVAHGLKVVAAGGGAGQIDFGAGGGEIDFERSQSLDNLTISTQGGANTLQAIGTLTLGSSAQVQTASSRVTFSGGAVVNNGTMTTSGTSAGITLLNKTFTNNGVIAIDGYFNGVYADGGTFTNHGEISVSGSNSHFSSYAREFVNAADGSVIVGAGDTVSMGNYVHGAQVSHFDNLGTISVATGATLTMGGHFTAAQIGDIVNNGVVNLRGTIDNSGATLKFGTGGLDGNVIVYSLIQGGTVVNDAPGLDLQGILSDVQWRGTLDLLSYANLGIESGSTFTGLDGSGPGTIIVEGAFSSLQLDGEQTLDNATIYLGSASQYGLFNDSIMVNPLQQGLSTTVTLGVNLTLAANVAGSKSLIFPGDYQAQITLVNDGVIEAEAAAGQLQVTVPAFVNHGALVVSNGDYANFQFVRSFSNTGTVTVSGGSSFSFNGSGGSGAMSVDAGCTIGIDGAFTTATLAGIQNNGTAIIGGSLDNTGQTITIGSGPLFGGQLTELAQGGNLDANGFIKGGVLSLGGGAIAWAGGGLVNVEVQGGIDLSAADAAVSLSGVTLTGAGGVGAGAINITGASASLSLDGSQTLDNASITVGDSGGSDVISLVSNTTQTVTLGVDLTINANVSASTVVITYVNFVSTVDLINQGTLNAGAASGTMLVELPTFTNEGLLAITNGDAVSVDATINGTGAISLAGADLTVGAVESGQTLAFADGGGSLTLRNAGAFAATLAGFQSGDRIDLQGIKATTLTLSQSDQLIVMNGSTVVATLQLEGSYQLAQFKLSNDKAGGSLIMVNTGAMNRMSQAMAALGGEAEAAQTPAPVPIGRAGPLLLHGV